ncbi:hypothetical protein RCL_jg24263.t1 [Rhizophagus clarus]|uniref:Uncharacterized protein n=1 Tax=Rhizophagus clarus TaxID=94130 RepID=A0A8H3KVY2_9GLOM|nr:hypothetical protein RCL_jg9995.t1 [Rhizophagus clarus]GES99681.1 hypothetical protein RCL_jg24263.t1 [Rhizophagus clarus]
MDCFYKGDVKDKHHSLRGTLMKAIRKEVDEDNINEFEELNEYFAKKLIEDSINENSKRVKEAQKMVE